jgi:hypothetical protein
MLSYAVGGSWGGVGGVAHTIDEQRAAAHADTHEQAATYDVAHTIHDASSLFGGGAVAIAEGGDVSDLFGPPPAMPDIFGAPPVGGDPFGSIGANNNEASFFDSLAPPPPPPVVHAAQVHAEQCHDAYACSRMLTYAHVCSRMLTPVVHAAQVHAEQNHHGNYAYPQQQKYADVC